MSSSRINSLAAYTGRNIGTTSSSAMTLSEFTNSDYRELLMPELSRLEVLTNNPRFEPLLWLKSFEEQYPVAFKVMRLCGTYPLNSQDSGKQTLPHLGQHCVTAAACANAISHLLAARNIIAADEAERIVIKALVHDCKRMAERSSPRNPVNSDSPRMLLTALYEKELLRLKRLGVKENMIQLVRESWAETGRYSLRNHLAVENGFLLHLRKSHYQAKVVFFVGFDGLYERTGRLRSLPLCYSHSMGAPDCFSRNPAEGFSLLSRARSKRLRKDGFSQRREINTERIDVSWELCVTTRNYRCLNR